MTSSGQEWQFLVKCIYIYMSQIDIYGICKEIDGKTFIFQVNLGMLPLRLIVLEKQALF